MAELDRFERRVAEDLWAYADEMPTRVDAAAVAARVLREGGVRRRLGRTVPGAASVPRAAWMLLAAALLLLLGGLVAVGSGLLDGPRFRLVMPAVRAEVVVPGELGPAVVTASDGAAWAIAGSSLVRLDPATGEARAWDLVGEIGFPARALAPARDDGVWLVGADRIRRVDAGGAGDVLGVPVEDLVEVVEASDGTIWVSAGNEGILHWDGDTWTTIAPRGASTGTGAATGAIALDAAGGLWVAELRYPGPEGLGVSRYDGSRWTTYTHMSDEAPIPVVTAMAAEPGGAMWLGTPMGLLRFDAGGWTSFSGADLGVPGGWAPAVGPAGDVWAVESSLSGPVHVARYAGGAWTVDGSREGLPAPGDDGYSLGSLAVTPDGPVAATHAGIYRLAGDRWERAWPEQPAISVPFLDVVATSAGEAWGLSRGAWGGDTTEVWHVTPDSATPETVGDAAPPVRDLALATDGTLWAATDAGVAARVGGEWTFVDTEAALGIAVGPDGTVWAGGAGEVVRALRRTDEGWLVDRLPPAPAPVHAGGMRSGIVGPSMAVDGEGRPWISGGHRGWLDTPGLLRYDGVRWEAMEPVPGSEAVVFNTVIAAPDGSVWVTIDTMSTNGSCCPPADPATQVAQYDGETWTVFGTGDGLTAGNLALSLALGPDGAPWLSTTGGIYGFDGLRWALAFDGDLGAIAVAPDGTIWASGASGVVRIGAAPD